MKYRELGKTGLLVSELSFGASPLGGVFGEVTQSHADSVVRSVLDSGVNLLDVAPFYGITRAETALGEALRGVSRDSYYLSTKVGRYGMAEFDYSAERVSQSVEESLGRLKTDYVDLLFCHDIEFSDLNQVIQETLPALRRVQEQGKARFIGVSGLPMKIFETVLAQTEVDMIISYCHYTLQNQRLTRLLPLLKSRGVGVINAAPLSMGLLTHKPLTEWHPVTPEIRAGVEKARAFCQERGVDLAQVALSFALANPDIDSTLIGTAFTEEWQRNLIPLENPIPESVIQEVWAILEPVRDQMWLYGRPENNA